MPAFTRHLPPWLRSAARAADLRVARSYPTFYLRNLPRSLRPHTFTDRIRRKMLFDRRPYLATTADKVSARAYVERVIGAHVLTEAYAIAEDPRTIDWSALPHTYVAKATHASGGVIVVTEDAEPDARLPAGADARWQRFFIRPEHATAKALIDVASHWVRTRFGWGPGSTHEHQYRHMTPRVLVEELLRHADGGVAFDHNFYVFHGRCELIGLVSHRMTDMRHDRFDRDWTPVAALGKTPPSDVPPPAPPNLAEMVRIAEALGAETDFVRVDLYDLGDRVAFGELTNTPLAGKDALDPAYDRMLGDFWAGKRPAADGAATAS